MENKVAIVGAGICGLYISWKLSGKGYKVVVFEKKEKVGKFACSGLFSEKILGFLPESEKLIQNQIKFVLIHFPKRTLKINFPKNFFVMSHFELDNLTAELAEKAGAKIIFNNPITFLSQGFDKVIGCDGASSAIRENLGLAAPHFRLGIQGFVATPTPNFGVGANFVETWPTKNGFLWKIPRGNEIEYGIIEEPKEAKGIFDNFLQRNNLVLEKINSALIPQGLVIPSNPAITLCGDAAGLTKPWSGGGVMWSLIAADILLKNFPDFLKYKKEVKRFFLPKIVLTKIATKMVYFLGFHFPWLLPKNYTIEEDFLI